MTLITAEFTEKEMYLIWQAVDAYLGNSYTISGTAQEKLAQLKMRQHDEQLNLELWNVIQSRTK